MSTPSEFILQLTSGSTPQLKDGAILRAEDLVRFKVNSANGAFAEVSQNPNDPTVLGLKNLTQHAWAATLADGSSHQVEPGRNIKLATGTTLNLGPVAGTLRETVAGFSLVLSSVVAVPLQIGQKVTASALFGWRGSGPVAEVTRNPSDPSMLGLKNLSTQTWLADIPGGGQRQITSGKTVRLTAGTKINFGPIKGEVQKSVPGNTLGDNRPYFNTALANPPPKKKTAPLSGQNAKAWEFDWQDLRPYLFSGGIVLCYTLLTGNLTAPVVTIGLALLLRQFGPNIDDVLAPVWPHRDKIPLHFRTILAWVAPVSIAYVITGSAMLFALFSWIPFIGPDASVFTCMAIIGTFLIYLLIREPQKHQKP